MSRRNFAVILMSAIAVVALAWLFHTPAPAAMPEKTVATPKPAPQQIQAPKLAPTQIAPPVAGPANGPAEPTGEVAARACGDGPAGGIGHFD